jgi:hypothetical protein
MICRDDVCEDVEVERPISEGHERNSKIVHGFISRLFDCGNPSLLMELRCVRGVFYYLDSGTARRDVVSSL